MKLPQDFDRHLVEKSLDEAARIRKDRYLSVDDVISAVWQMILDGLPYVSNESETNYMLNQARHLKCLMDKSAYIKRDIGFCDVKKILENEVQLKDESLEAEKGYIHPHNRNVAKYATAVCRALDFSEEETSKISFSARIHDIGKIAIPDHILNKPAGLSGFEWIRMKSHPAVGGKILTLMSELFKLDLERTIKEVEQHHERFYGGGYPYNLQGDEISKGAQIISICDVFDALTSKRPYRDPFTSPGLAFQEMRKNDRGNFNPELLVKTFDSLAESYLEVQKN